jgi:acetyl-CoA acetyltransferase
MTGMRGKTAIVGIGKTPWYKRGTSPDSEVKMAVRAIVAAAEDAGVDPRDVDGFVSWGSEKNSGTNMMAALGTRELRYGALVWMHGGGSSGSIGLASMAIATEQAEYVVVIRAMAEKGANSRLGRAVFQGLNPPHLRVNGMSIPAQNFAMHASRLLDGDGLPRESVRDFVLANSHHAERNPDATGRLAELDAETYESSRSPIEPLHLFDNSRENDCAIALLLTSAERARDLHQTPAYVLASTMGRYGGADSHRWQSPDGKTTSGFRSVADRCWKQSGYGPADVDVVQVYSNSSTAAVAGLIDHGTGDDEVLSEFERSWAYIVQVVNDRRAEPTGDVISQLIAWDPPFTDEQIHMMILNVSLGANDTTKSLLAQALIYVDKHPELRARFMDRPDEIRPAIDEFLRLMPVAMGPCRTATRDVEIDGLVIKKNERLMLSFPAANFDPAKYPNPQDFDLDRGAAQHLAMGVGTHFCLGAWLAKTISATTMRQLLTRCPNFSIDHDAVVIGPNRSSLTVLQRVPAVVGELP